MTAAGPFAVLCAAGRDVAGTVGPEAFRAVASGDHDWHDVLALAHAHRMVALVGARLDQLPPAAVPSDALAAWRAARVACATDSLAAAGELARVVTVLRAAGVEAVAYKGPALSVVVYGDAGVRPCADLDLVVPPREYGAARAALRGAGLASRHGFSRVQEAMVMYGQGHAEFAQPGRDAPFVELHWRFAAERLPWSPPVHAVRARAERVRIGGVDVLAPSANDQLLLLALHGTRHAWEQLEWLVGLGVLLQRGTVDANVALRRARAVGGVRALLVGAELARRVLGVAVPEGLVRRAAEDARVNALVGAVMRRWDARHEAVVAQVRADCGAATRADGRRRERADERAEEWAFEDACIERLRDRARWLLARALLPTLREWEVVQLPAILTPLYVPFRVARLAWRGLSGGGGDA